MESTTLNIEKSSDPVYWHDYVSVALVFLFFSVAIILLVLSFPLFVFVTVTNRDWDKETSIYPITNHFFKAICWYYLLLFFFIVHSLFEGPDFWNYEKHDMVFPGFWAFLMMFICHTHHIILSYLALQRFLIYFFPSSEKYIAPKNLGVAFRYCYFTILIVFAIVLWNSVGADSNSLNVYYIILHIVLFFSAALYIPIVVSIRKLQHLASSMKNKPHKYILYQTIIIVSFKAGHLISLYFSFPDDPIVWFCLLDIISTPLTIQTSYLMCNRRTLDTIRKKLTLSNIYRTVFKRNSVEPYVQEVDATTVAPPT